MRFKDFFRRFRKERKLPWTWEESDWIPFATVPNRSGKLWVGDVQFAPNEEDGAIVEVPPGEYRCSIKELRFSDGDVRVSRLRGCIAGSSPVLGPQIGTTWADTASQAICDFEVYKAAAEADPEYEEAANDNLWVQDLHNVYEHVPGAVIAFCSSGWGDGTFKLFELLENGRRVGVEIEMLDKDDPLPD